MDMVSTGKRAKWREKAPCNLAPNIDHSIPATRGPIDTENAFASARLFDYAWYSNMGRLFQQDGLPWFTRFGASSRGAFFS